MRRTFEFWMLFIALALLVLGCKKGEDAKGEGPGAKGKTMSFPVEVVPVAAERVEYTVTAVGSVDAFERVQLVARVAGAVEHVRFKEGDTVKKGQVMVEIDPARYSVAVRSAKASLEKAMAAKADADTGLSRREDAGAENAGVFSSEEVSTWRTRARSSNAQVAEAQAALDTASINLRDAFVRAPIAGKIQSRTVQTGQYVQPGTVLATILQRDPLLLRFQVPEIEAPRIKQGMAAHFEVRSDERRFKAAISYVSDAADSGTRMVSVTAEIDAAVRDELRPGAFAEVSVPVGENPAAPVIPQSAVRPSEKGFLAFVIVNGAANERVLSLGLRTEDGRVEVKSGLKAGEMLVVRGAEALREGVPVRVVPPGQSQSQGEAKPKSESSAPSQATPAPSASGSRP